MDNFSVAKKVIRDWWVHKDMTEPIGVNTAVSLLMQMFESERPMFRIGIDVLVSQQIFH